MSRASLEVISDVKAWARAYDRLVAPSVLASHAYMRAGARLVDGGVAEAAVVELGGEILFHPFIRRPVPFAAGLFDLISVYDFGGFWFSTDSAEQRQMLISEFEQVFAEYAQRQGIVCEYIRCHPMTDVSALTFQRYSLRKHQDNAIVRLTGTIEGLRAAYSDNRRPSVRQGYRNGLSMQFVEDPSIFMQVYYASLDRLGADRSYYFPASFISEIKSNLLVAHVTSPDGRLCAAYAFLIDHKGIFLFLAASEPETLPLRPNDFGYDAIIAYGLASGFDYFHLGGGAPSLYRYKSSFSSDKVAFFHASAIFLPLQYEELVEDHHARFPAAVERSFFPRYRAALGSVVPSASPGGT